MDRVFYVHIAALLRGAIVNRTDVTHKNYLFTYFYEQHLVLFIMVPRNSVIRQAAWAAIGRGRRTSHPLQLHLKVKHSSVRGRGEFHSKGLLYNKKKIMEPCRAHLQARAHVRPERVVAIVPLVHLAQQLLPLVHVLLLATENPRPPLEKRQQRCKKSGDGMQ